MKIENKKGFIFDLDGVITETADLHFKAWKAMGEKINVEVSEEMDLRLRGVSRTDSLEIILNENGVTLEQTKKDELLEFKNNYYLELLETINEKNIINGIVGLLKQIKTKGYGVALASTSKNAPLILEKLNLLDQFDFIVDPSKLAAQKPAPDIFIEGARLLGLDASDCIVFEDAQSGVDGSVAANIEVVAYEPAEQNIKNATYNISDFNDVEIL